MRRHAHRPCTASVLLLMLLGAGAGAQDVKPVTNQAPPESAAPAADTPAGPAPTAASKPSDPRREAGEPRASTSVAAPAEGAKGRARNRNAADRVDLDTTNITGNRELPKVMYVVPWKHSDIGDLVGRPANSLLDEVLAPVDRNVFKREVQYYQALKPDTSAPAGQPQAAPTATQ